MNLLLNHENEYLRKKEEKEVKVSIEKGGAKLYFVDYETVHYYDHYPDEVSHLISPNVRKGIVNWSYES